MLNPLKDVLTVEMVRSLIAKIKGALATKVSMGDVVSSWQSTPDDAHVPTEKLVKDTLDNLPPGTAVKGDAESEYRTGNVNLTPANIGAATASQGAKADTAVQGVKVNGTELTKDENNKVSIPDGTTAQKGVVQLSNAINSPSSTEAATPKAVKDAYDELNNKIVARAVFLSQAEWAVQSQIPGDPAKVYYVEDGTGEDAYTVYVWKESTSEYVEVDESSIDLDGYWHDGPNTTGNGNVVTGISLGNDGVPQVVKGITALTQHQSVTDNNPTLAWGSTSTVGTVGGTSLQVTMPSNPASGKQKNRLDVSATTYKIVKLFRAYKFKTSSTIGTTVELIGRAGDTAVRVVINIKGSITADYIQFYDSYGDTKLNFILYVAQDPDESSKNLIYAYMNSGSTLYVNTADTSAGDTDIDFSVFGEVMSERISGDTAITMRNLQDASWITRGTFGTDRIADDAITAAKVKDNETLPVNITGKAALLESTSPTGGGNFNDFVPTGTNEMKSYVFLGSYTNGPKQAAMTTYSGMLLSWHRSVGDYYQMFISSDLIAVRSKVSSDWSSWTKTTDASWISSGTFGTDRIADDAITAAKVKDNETLPVNVSGNASSASVLSVKRVLSSSDNIDDLENDEDFVYYHWLQNSIPSGTLPENITTYGYLLCEGHSNRKRQVMCIAGDTQKIYTRQCHARQGDSLIWTPWLALATVSGGGAGSTSTPVHVDANGQVQPCNPSLMTVGNATKWDGHAISIGTVVSSTGTISIA